MNIAIIGSGGREHALCFKLSESKKVKKIFCFPGNAGTENIAKNININLSDFEELKNCLLYTSPSPRDGLLSRMPSSA